MSAYDEAKMRQRQARCVESNFEENEAFCNALMLRTTVPDPAILPIYLNFFPDGASVKHSIHFQQLTRDQQYFR